MVRIQRILTTNGRLSVPVHTQAIRRYSSYLGRDGSFFDRKKELALFDAVFSSEQPTIHVVLGPPSSGKTALIRQVLYNGKYNPLIFDLRSSMFETPYTLYHSLRIREDLWTSVNTIKEKLNLAINDRKIDQSLAVAEGKASVALTMPTQKLGTVGIRDLLDTIALPVWRVIPEFDVLKPIMFIDEANCLAALCRTSKGVAILDMLLQWLVLNTIQDGRYHVVLSSSDSFFNEWITQRIHALHIFPLVVGDLNKEDAMTFFHEHVLAKNEFKHIQSELESKFEQVCNITGTRMYIIQKYVESYSNFKKNGLKMDVTHFFLVRSELFKLTNALDPDITYPMQNVNIQTKPPRWKKDHLITAMRELVMSHKKGYVTQMELTRKIGQTALQSLIEYNILHCRPTDDFAFDIINPPAKPIITAMSQPALRAMDMLLKDLDRDCNISWNDI